MAMDVNLTRAAQAYARASSIVDPAQSGTEDAAVKGTSFKALLSTAMDNAVGATGKAELTSMAASIGKADINDLVAAVNNADLTLQTVAAVRDKVIGAYQEIMRMPI